MLFTRYKTVRQYRALAIQSFMVFVIMFGFLLAMVKLGQFSQALGAIGATSLGSSAFLAFVAHDTAMACTRRMLSGYAVGLAIGSLFNGVLLYATGSHWLLLPIAEIEIIITAMAATITMITMVLLSSEHPPAVGLTIGLVISNWSDIVLLIITVTVIVIALTKKVMKNHLINLL